MLEYLVNFFKVLTSTAWYGSVTLDFKAGRVVHIKKTESIKPPLDI